MKHFSRIEAREERARQNSENVAGEWSIETAPTTTTAITTATRTTTATEKDSDLMRGTNEKRPNHRREQ